MVSRKTERRTIAKRLRRDVIFGNKFLFLQYLALDPVVIPFDTNGFDKFEKGGNNICYLKSRV